MATTAAAPPARRTQAQRRTETRAAVLASAIRLFGENGYAQTSLEEIAADSGVTIRPIYHYFGNKLELFRAATDATEARIVETLTRDDDHAATDDRLAAWHAFRDLCRDRAFRQIVLVDSPNVLGRERWTTSPVTRAAEGFLASSHASNEKRALATRMLLGALAEGALSIAESHDPDKAAAVVDQLVARIVTALAPKRDEDAPE